MSEYLPPVGFDFNPPIVTVYGALNQILATSWRLEVAFGAEWNLFGIRTTLFLPCPPPVDELVRKSIHENAWASIVRRG